MPTRLQSSSATPLCAHAHPAFRHANASFTDGRERCILTSWDTRALCTQMVKLNRVTAGLGAGAATVLLKLEMQNPGGSVKDRIAAFIIEQAEQRGEVPERPSRGALLLRV